MRDGGDPGSKMNSPQEGLQSFQSFGHLTFFPFFFSLKGTLLCK